MAALARWRCAVLVLPESGNSAPPAHLPCTTKNHYRFLRLVLTRPLSILLFCSQGNRKIALCTVVGLLEDGETYSTELKQRQKPEQGKMGQWEHELVVHR